VTHRHDHCPECGVSAGLVCRDLDDEPATETCPDRPLLPLRDSVERCKPSVSKPKAPRKPANRNNRRRVREQTTSRAGPKMRECVICGALVKAHGVKAAYRAACPGACREARERQRVIDQSARMRAKTAAAPAMVPCHWCGVLVTGRGRRPWQRTCCGSVACVMARHLS
jgi:hypothetical protein